MASGRALERARPPRNGVSETKERLSFKKEKYSVEVREEATLNYQSRSLGLVTLAWTISLESLCGAQWVDGGGRVEGCTGCASKEVWVSQEKACTQGSELRLGPFQERRGTRRWPSEHKAAGSHQEPENAPGGKRGPGRGRDFHRDSGVWHRPQSLKETKATLGMSATRRRPERSWWHP